MFDTIPGLFRPQLRDLSQRREAREHSRQSETRCQNSFRNITGAHVTPRREHLFFTLFCSKTVWSWATLARVGACTPGPHTLSTSPHAGTGPPSASSQTATTVSRWTCGAPAVSSLRSSGTRPADGHAAYMVAVFVHRSPSWKTN